MPADQPFPSEPAPATEVRTVAFVLYPGLTPLDLVGPLQVFSALESLDPRYRTLVVGERTGPVASDTPLMLAPGHTFAEVPAPYAVVVPGGLEPTLAAMADETLLGYLRTAAGQAGIVGSVCTGSLLLAAAGLLDGRRATTHWMFRDLLPRFGATPVAERWVEDGRYVTAAGVSAGIDLALHLVHRLAGEQLARTVQLFIEYDPEPPLGPIDWAAADTAGYAPYARKALETALAPHPALLARLTP